MFFTVSSVVTEQSVYLHFKIEKMVTDSELFEEMTAHFIEYLKLPPLSARVYAYMLFDFKREGVSFDELVENLQASKSSISNTLNLLVQQKHLTIFNKLQDRKRYYRMNLENTEQRYQNVVNYLTVELDIITKLQDHKAILKIENEIYDAKIEAHKKLLSEVISTLNQIISSLKISSEYLKSLSKHT